MVKEDFIDCIESIMKDCLSDDQIAELKRTLKESLEGYVIVKEGEELEESTIQYSMVDLFISSKKIEGCSNASLKYYERTIRHMITSIGKDPKVVSTEDLRLYLTSYQEKRTSSRVTIDNIRRILSSFYAWMEDEDHIIKSPVRRIHKVKTGKVIKEIYSDETLEVMRDNCSNSRDLAIVDMLASTGMRIGEMVNLKITDINFVERECLVLGKGNKERVVYFDARTKIHLQRYLQERTDDNKALFVSNKSPHKKLTAAAIEAMLRKMGNDLNINKVHPHKFRRTLATTAIDKGMPIEQVQRLLGHQKIDTTLQYAMVKQQNVKNSHRKFIS